MAQAQANGISIAYERDGPASAEAVLLIHGVGGQLVQWPDAYVQGLLARGFQVIRFDNRDIGLSTHFDDAGFPDLEAALTAKARGESPDIPYTVRDMAADTRGLLDALGIARAHVVGASLGGMIAQTLAIEAPKRVASVTIMMSLSGSPDISLPDPAALTVPIPDLAEDEAGFIKGSIAMLRAIGGKGYPMSDDYLASFALLAARRSQHPAGAWRQLVAGRTGEDRSEGLRRLQMPALVIHGTDDPLIPVACGEDIARKIPGSYFLRIDGMGHDLPPALAETFATMVALNAGRG